MLRVNAQIFIANHQLCSPISLFTIIDLLSLFFFLLLPNLFPQHLLKVIQSLTSASSSFLFSFVLFSMRIRHRNTSKQRNPPEILCPLISSHSLISYDFSPTLSSSHTLSSPPVFHSFSVTIQSVDNHRQECGSFNPTLSYTRYTVNSRQSGILP